MTRWIGHLLVLGVMPAGFVLLAQDPVTVDPRHYTVEIDNRKVRTLRVHYEPGEGSPMHEHSAGVRVFLTDIHNRFIAPDGSTSESSRVAGEIIWAEPVRHSNTNLGKNRVEIIELELKGLPAHPASRAGPGATMGQAPNIRSHARLHSGFQLLQLPFGLLEVEGNQLS